MDGEHGMNLLKVIWIMTSRVQIIFGFLSAAHGQIFLEILKEAILQTLPQII
jgi:hypothetical protein